MTPAARDTAVSTARNLLELDEIGPLHFRSRHNQPNHNGMLFGGQALAQALAAAQRTLPDWPAHNCNAYYLRGGAIDTPVDYEVERLRDGRRYAARRVRAGQQGRVIFEMLCSFHDPEHGFAHQQRDAMDVPAPTLLSSLASYVVENADRLPREIVDRYSGHFPIEVRLIQPECVFFEHLPTPHRDFWIRMPSAQQVSRPGDHQCLLAFLSDYWLAGVAAAQHRSPITADGFSITTLNYSLWFHAPTRADQWLLYRTESPWAGDGRGVARGLLYDRDGTLVASVVQEAAMREPRA